MFAASVVVLHVLQQQEQQNILFQYFLFFKTQLFITRPDLHPADLIFVRTVNIDPHPADVHRADHKKFDTLQTITVQTLFS